MSQKILVGVDGADGGRDAIALARVLAHATHGDITLVHAFPLDIGLGRPATNRLVGELRHDAQALLVREREHAKLPQATPLIPVADMHPARALHRLAEQDHTKIIIVGSTHREGAGRVLLGDVTASTVHGAPCPVAVAPAGFRDTAAELRLIGVGFDGTPDSRAAVQLAEELVCDVSGHLRVLTAFDDTIPVLAPYPAGYAAISVSGENLDARRRDAERILAQVAGDGASDRSGEVLVGEAGAALEAASSDLDALVVGSRDYGPVRRVLLGSTARHLAHHARCPLVIVPRGARVRDEGEPEAAPTGADTPTTVVP